MNFDRNTVIGFVVLALLFFGYFYYNNQEAAKYKLENARKEFVKDSIAKANKPVDTLAQKKDSTTADTQRVVAEKPGRRAADLRTDLDHGRPELPPAFRRGFGIPVRLHRPC